MYYSLLYKQYTHNMAFTINLLKFILKLSHVRHVAIIRNLSCDWCNRTKLYRMFSRYLLGSRKKIVFILNRWRINHIFEESVCRLPSYPQMIDSRVNILRERLFLSNLTRSHFNRVTQTINLNNLKSKIISWTHWRSFRVLIFYRSRVMAMHPFNISNNI